MEGRFRERCYNGVRTTVTDGPLTGDCIMDLRERIVSDPDILLGKPAVQGTRISVAFVLSLLAGGTGEAEIVKYYPNLTVEDIRACCLYASENLAWDKPAWMNGASFLDTGDWEWVEGGPETVPRKSDATGING